MEKSHRSAKTVETGKGSLQKTTIPGEIFSPNSIHSLIRVLEKASSGYRLQSYNFHDHATISLSVETSWKDT